MPQFFAEAFGFSEFSFLSYNRNLGYAILKLCNQEDRKSFNPKPKKTDQAE